MQEEVLFLSYEKHKSVAVHNSNRMIQVKIGKENIEKVGSDR